MIYNFVATIAIKEDDPKIKPEMIKFILAQNLVDAYQDKIEVKIATMPTTQGHKL